MKIITSKAAYVQKNDIEFLNEMGMIPTSIYLKVYGTGYNFTDDSNRYEFIEFTDPEEIEFFNNIDWLIAYDKVKDLTEEEIIALYHNMVEKREAIAQKYNSMPPEEQKKDLNLVVQCDLLAFKIFSLRDVLWFRQGHLNMNLPDGIESPSVLYKKD